MDLTALVSLGACLPEGETTFSDALDLKIPLTTGESRLDPTFPGAEPSRIPRPLILHTTDAGNTWIDESETLADLPGRGLTSVATPPARP